MRPRSLALLALLLAPLPALTGCLGAWSDPADGDGEGPRLAVPTDKPALPPSRPTPQEAPVNFSDPGYVMRGNWSVGDGWDYESNRSHFVRLRVVEARVVGENRTDYRVEERTGIVGNAPRTHVTYWVRGDTWTRVNMTDHVGNLVTTFEPGEPLRHHFNGTYRYNRTLGDGRAVHERASVVANTRYADRQTLLFPWGYVETGRVEHRVVTSIDGKITRTFVAHWVHRDYLNSVQFQVDDELFTLTAAQVGGMRRGTLK